MVRLIRLHLDNYIMRKLLFLLLFLPILSFSQNLDFETTGFDIKALTLTSTPRSILSYTTNNEQIPSRIKAFDSRSRQEIVNAQRSLIYTIQSSFAAKNVKNPVITIAPLDGDNVQTFWGDSSIDVKNIAYKPSNGGNVFSAYCAATYAANNPQN